MNVSKVDNAQLATFASVYLDGEPVEHWTLANDKAGFVIQEKRVNGQPVFGKGNNRVCEKLTGNVEIRLSDDAPAQLKQEFEAASASAPSE